MALILAPLLLAGTASVADPPAFRFVSTVAVPAPDTGERRGFHTVLAAPHSSGDHRVWGAGISGELVAVDFARPEAPVLLSGTVRQGERLLQSRTLLWSAGELLVANRDWLFYNSSAAAPHGPALLANVSAAALPAHGCTGHCDDGINGIAALTDATNDTLLVGGTMHGQTLEVVRPASAGRPPASAGALDVSGWIGPPFDVAGMLDPAGAPVAVVVSPTEAAVLTVLTVADAGGRFLPPPHWSRRGGLNHSWPGAVGCNRVRVR